MAIRPSARPCEKVDNGFCWSFFWFLLSFLLLMMMMICFSTLWLGSSMFCVCRSPDLVTNRPCRRGTVSSSSSDFSRRSVTLAFSYFLIRCSPPALPRVRSTCTGFYWVFPVFFPGLEKIGFDFGTRYRVFLGFPGFYWVLLGFTVFFRDFV